MLHNTSSFCTFIIIEIYALDRELGEHTLLFRALYIDQILPWLSFFYVFLWILLAGTLLAYSVFLVCVCVCACVCVCVWFILFHLEGFFLLQDVWDIREDLRCYVVSIISGVFAKFLHIHFWKCQYFTSIRRNSITLTSWRETIWYILLAKRWHMLM